MVIVRRPYPGDCFIEIQNTFATRVIGEKALAAGAKGSFSRRTLKRDRCDQISRQTKLDNSNRRLTFARTFFCAVKLAGGSCNSRSLRQRARILSQDSLLTFLILSQDRLLTFLILSKDGLLTFATFSNLG
jgi:hypothetical protein